ncbi:hypothetical protein ACS0TY_007642 [Phlomoides rotata]
MAEPQAAPSAPPPPATSTRTRTNAPPPTACACNRRPPPPPAPVTARNRQVIALQDLDLLKILESELHRELSSMSFQGRKWLSQRCSAVIPSKEMTGFLRMLC